MPVKWRHLGRRVVSPLKTVEPKGWLWSGDVCCASSGVIWTCLCRVNADRNILTTSLLVHVGRWRRRWRSMTKYDSLSKVTKCDALSQSYHWRTFAAAVSAHYRLLTSWYRSTEAFKCIMGIGVKSGWHPYVHGHVCSPLMFPYGVVRPVVDLYSAWTRDAKYDKVFFP